MAFVRLLNFFREREVDEKMKLLDKFKTELLNKQKAKDLEQKDAKVGANVFILSLLK